MRTAMTLVVAAGVLASAGCGGDGPVADEAVPSSGVTSPNGDADEGTSAS